ncbi:Hypothetical protein NTJ_14858 [Nesidiocoris tenuis]|uniref:Uncharacterized protein n=1 Tax=Nesidiocoris tenuis TaxID=355587 RepID=A0ABN7BCE0_9HEMI|nr:Hypothetical protein NTJ_14858 [Nesidiocoris tenuis]
MDAVWSERMRSFGLRLIEECPMLKQPKQLLRNNVTAVKNPDTSKPKWRTIPDPRRHKGVGSTGRISKSVARGCDARSCDASTDANESQPRL